MTAGTVTGKSEKAEQVLAYVFWHRPAQGQKLADYEAALISFHRRLAVTPVAGLLASRALRVPDLPWVPDGGYEDWYLLRGYADLCSLNTAAVDPDRRQAHDDIAGRNGRGSGALYQLSAGTVADTPSWATWVSKPRALPYADFYDRLFGHIGPPKGRPLPSGLGVWRRQLVLGPAPEFCITAPQPLPTLPLDWPTITVPYTAVTLETTRG